MKKIMTLVAALFVAAGSSAFAKSYHGDIQLHAGLNLSQGQIGYNGPKSIK